MALARRKGGKTMAYLARIERADVADVVFVTATSPVPAYPASQTQFTPLEWSIVRLARVDGLWTIRPLSWLRRLYHRLIGLSPNPSLANERLEALRRIAVLSWHFGFSVPGDDVAEFLSAGFSANQYELLVSSVRSSFYPSGHGNAREVLA
jgi:hypothetical protein